jgi:hypothetical protein
MSSRIFVKFEMVLLGKSGPGEKMKKAKKIRDTVPEELFKVKMKGCRK